MYVNRAYFGLFGAPGISGPFDCFLYPNLSVLHLVSQRRLALAKPEAHGGRQIPAAEARCAGAQM